jgi:hypothetical protein
LSQSIDASCHSNDGSSYHPSTPVLSALQRKHYPNLGVGVQKLRFFPRHPIVRLGFTPDGSEIVTAQPHTSIAVRNRFTGEARITFPTENIVSFSDLQIHPTANLIAVRCAKWCRVYKIQAGPPDCEPFNSSVRYQGIALNPTGFRFFHIQSEYLHRNDCGNSSAGDTGTKNFRIRSTAELVMVTPDARFGLAVRQRTRPILIDLSTGRVSAEVQSALRTRNSRLGHAVYACASDSTKLAIGTGDSLAVFDLTRVQTDENSPDEGDEETSKKKKVLYPLFTLDRPDPFAGRGTQADRTAERWLPPLAFDPTGQTLLAVGLRNRVQRIDVATGSVIVEWGWRADTVRSLAIAPDGLTAAAGCRLGELIVWDLE